MYEITVSVLIGIGFSLLTALISNILVKHKTFREAFKILTQYRLPEKPRSKSELRKYRKIKTLVKTARRRFFALLLIQMLLIAITYFLAIFLIAVLTRGNELVEIPIPIPLLTSRGESGFYTYTYLIGFIAYITPLYLLMRSVSIRHKELQR
ncbi:MAG: hypothetical protein ABWW65_00515 [Thermoprotei archaeon]